MDHLDYDSTAEFQKDFKRLLKRYRSLADDLEVAKLNAIELFHLHHIDNQSVVKIPNLGTDAIHIYKLRKFACKSIPGKGAKSGIRIVYAFIPASNKVIFLEMYHKSDQENESKERVKEIAMRFIFK